MKFKKIVTALMTAGVAAGTLTFSYAQAQSASTTGTLQKIRDTGTVSLGHRESSIPFSYYAENQRVVGYAHEYAMQIVKAIEQELNKPHLDVKLTPITSQNRIPLLQNGTIDLECGSTTNNLERQQQAAFSNTIFVVNTRLLTRVDSGVKDFADLKGKTVATTAGTTSERILRAMNQAKKLGMNIISAKDHSEAFLMLETGRAVAFMMDDALLAGERAKAKDPSRFVIVGTPQSQEAYGCMLRKNDPAFKKLVDDTIAKLQTSGEAIKIYQKWFQKPIPPRNLNLNFPQSEELKALFKSPNDQAKG